MTAKAAGRHAGPPRPITQRFRRWAATGGTALALGIARLVLLLTVRDAWGAFGDLLLVAVGVWLFSGVYVFSLEQGHNWVGPRPRWHYLLFCLGFLSACGASVVIALWAREHHLRWLSLMLIGPAVMSCLGALVTVGRAAFRGRARRVFWWRTFPWA